MQQVKYNSQNNGSRNGAIEGSEETGQYQI